MTRLLVSVRSVAEARDALSAGVDLVDLKEPRRGALGAVDWDVAAKVALFVAGRAPLSMALGELVDDSEARHRKQSAARRQKHGAARRQKHGAAHGQKDAAAHRETGGELAIPHEVTYAKLGLAGAAKLADWPGRWRTALEALPAATTPVAVVYADWRAAQAPGPADVLAEGRKLGCGALLVDTWRKTGGGLLEVMEAGELAELLARARAGGMLGVVGGSLTWDTLAPVLELNPDYVAVRGAVCQGSRLATLDAALVERWVKRVHHDA